MAMRVVFAGSPAVAVPYLETLVESGFSVLSAITRRDAPKGRKRILTATPVALAAERLGIPTIKTNSLRGVEIPPCDVGVVVAYGGLVPPNLLDTPTHGWVNVHFSLLPEYRGAAPLQRSLWDGQTSGGISIFRLVEELDAGPLLLSKSLSYNDDETASEALTRFAHDTTDELVGTLRLLDADGLTPSAQRGAPTFAPKFDRDEGRIDWTLPATTISHRIRAVTDEPGAFTAWANTTLGVLRARPGYSTGTKPGAVTCTDGDVVVGTGDGSLILEVVRPAGKSPMAASDWFRGLRESVTFE